MGLGGAVKRNDDRDQARFRKIVHVLVRAHHVSGTYNFAHRVHRNENMTGMRLHVEIQPDRAIFLSGFALPSFSLWII